MPATSSRQTPDRDAGGRRAALAYAAAWLCAAAIVVVPVALLLRPDHDATVTVPPIRDARLIDAARRSHCVLERALRGEALNPPVDGPARRRPARAGVYQRPLPQVALTSALRHGMVAIQVRDNLDGDARDALESIQSALPTGTILAPNGTRMPFAVAVTAYRRLLGCPGITPTTLDAVQLFRGRFVGAGPEAR
jgi:hypothetical protein